MNPSDVKQTRFRRLARLVASLEESSKTCESYRERLFSCDLAESKGQNAAQLDPEVLQHLETCLACQELYAELLTIARLEATNQLPRLAQAPQSDLSLLLPHSQTLAQSVYESVQAILQAVHPDYLAELELIRNRLLEWVADQLSSQPLQIPSAQTF